MYPKIKINSNADTLIFTLSDVNVSLANAIRRTILSDIPTVVFRTTPNEKNKANIIVNTSRLNNEIIKQRLSCIPIHIKDYEEFPLNKYIMEVNVENTSDTTIYVTTKDFTIKDILTGKVLNETKTREIFPPNEDGCYIDFLRLRPQLSNELLGEKIHLKCEFDIGSCKEDGMFNVVSTCSYGFTVDTVEQEKELTKKKQSWKDDGKSIEEIKFESDNWKLLEGLRITKLNSFDYIVESIGVYTNSEILNMSCDILIKKLIYFDTLIEKDELQIIVSQNTMINCYDIILENEDYTIGKVFEYFLYNKFYETNILTYCGFKKMHPHDSDSIIRVAYKEPIDKSIIKGNLKECIDDAREIFQKIKNEFLKTVK